jgi:hypothetical protein
VFLQEPSELGTPRGVDIELPTDVGETTDQCCGGFIAIDTGQGRIHTEIVSVRCRLENPFDGVLKNTAIFCLGLPQFVLHPLALGDLSGKLCISLR